MRIMPNTDDAFSAGWAKIAQRARAHQGAMDRGGPAPPESRLAHPAACSRPLSGRELLWSLIFAVICLPILQDADGQDDPTKKAPDSPIAIPANLVVKLRERVGKETLVSGHIERTSRSSGGHHFLNFSSSELTIVCFQEHVRKFKDQPPADAYKNKDVEVRGKIELYQGKLQIKLTDPAQIRIVKVEPASESRKIELKQVAPDVWVSPAGLRYAGRDPSGLTRVEHIQRHFQDDPERDGPHGVFD